VLISILGFVAAHPVTSLVGGAAVLSVTIYLLVLWQQRRAREAREAWQLGVARSQEIARYHAMGPDEFERALAYAPDGRKIVLQAKRFSGTNKVTGPDLQRFGGTCYTVHGARVAAAGVTWTLKRLTQQYAAHHGIRLFDLHGLAAWASRTGPAPWH